MENLILSKIIIIIYTVEQWFKILFLRQLFFFWSFGKFKKPETFSASVIYIFQKYCIISQEDITS